MRVWALQVKAIVVLYDSIIYMGIALRSFSQSPVCMAASLPRLELSGWRTVIGMPGVDIEALGIYKPN